MSFVCRISKDTCLVKVKRGMKLDVSHVSKNRDEEKRALKTGATKKVL